MIIPLGMFYFGKTTSLLILVPVCALAIIIEFARVRSPLVAKLVNLTFGSVMRPEEQPEVGSKVVINGATWVLLSATVLTFIFPVNIAVPAMVMFMIGDAAAALVGRRFGCHHWRSSPKTTEGSLAFFIVAFLCLLAFNFMPLSSCLLIASVAMILEILPVPFNDNLYVPLVSAGLIFCLQRFVHGQELVLFF